MEYVVKESLSGNWIKSIVAILIYAVLWNIIPGFLGPLGLIWYILMMPFLWGFYIFFLEIARGNKPGIANLFDGFKDYWRISSTMLLTYIYMILWSLLLIIPGIIKSLSYAMVPYILKDNPDMKHNKAIEKSMEMMDGQKSNLFLFFLEIAILWILAGVGGSLIGGIIVHIANVSLKTSTIWNATIALGSFYWIPNMYTGIAHFYENLKEVEEIITESEQTDEQ